MKYVNADVTVYLLRHSREGLDPNDAIVLTRGEEYADDDELVIERPDLFFDTKELA